MRSRWTAGVYSCTGVQQNCGDTARKEDPENGFRGKQLAGAKANPGINAEL